MIEYSLKRSKRKSLGIYIRPDGTVEVRASLKHPSKREIDAIVRERSEWIADNLRKYAEIREKKAAFRLDYGEKVKLLGEDYVIVGQNRKPCFEKPYVYLPENLCEDELRAELIKLYKALARSYYTSFTAQRAPLMDCKPGRLRLSSARTRWGSCSSKNDLNINWRLIMASPEVIEYVLIHELAHMKEHNHSAKFWGIVERELPDYHERIAQLRGFEGLMLTQRWGEY